MGPVVGSSVAPALALCFCPLSKICKVSQHQLQVSLIYLHLLSGTRLKSNIIFRYFLLEISSETQLIQNPRDLCDKFLVFYMQIEKSLNKLRMSEIRSSSSVSPCVSSSVSRFDSRATAEHTRTRHLRVPSRRSPPLLRPPGVRSGFARGPTFATGSRAPPRHLRLTSLLLQECQPTASRDPHDCNQSEWQSEPGGNCVLFNLGRLGGAASQPAC